MLSSMGICMYAAIQQVDTSLRAMAACNCIKKEANFNNKATLSMRLDLKHRTTAGGECTQHVRQKEIAVARVAHFQSLAQNAAHATRHAYLGTRHNVWYGTTTEQNGVESARGTLKTNYCLVDHVRSLDPVPLTYEETLLGRPGACCQVCNKSATHAF